jgi:hypothetical protein
MVTIVLSDEGSTLLRKDMFIDSLFVISATLPVNWYTESGIYHARACAKQQNWEERDVRRGHINER